jgi:hypothetical protein
MADAALVKVVMDSISGQAEDQGLTWGQPLIGIAVNVAEAVERYQDAPDLHYVMTLSWNSDESAQGLGSWSGLITCPGSATDEEIFNRVYKKAVDMAREQDPHGNVDEAVILFFRLNRNRGAGGVA